MFVKFVTRILFVVAFSLLVVQNSCAKKFSLPIEVLSIQKADGSEEFIRAELALKPEERNHGFMERKSIPDGTGMLFVFERDQVLSFWMKNTPHPLSIAYIDSSGTIRDIFDMKPFSEVPVKSTRSVRFALEVPEGWFKRIGIKAGDKVLLGNRESLRKFFFN